MSGIELLGTLYRLLRDAGEVQSSCVLFAACYAAETSRAKAITRATGPASGSEDDLSIRRCT